MARSIRLIVSLLALALTVSAAGATSPQEARRAAIVTWFEGNVVPWLGDPRLVSAIKAQNAEHADLDEAAIRDLDLEWGMQATAVEQPFVREILDREVSKFLAEKKAASGGMITEIILMDARGLNVGLSDVTSDYWQGDEAKWQKTFLVGPGSLFVDDPDKDESTQSVQVQASMTVSDPASGEAIGAITIGVNLDKL
jgi:hypothetical protein